MSIHFFVWLAASMFFHGQDMMKRQLREAETCQREAARTSALAKHQEARERRAEERKMQQMKQRELQRESPAGEWGGQWRKYSDIG